MEEKVVQVREFVCKYCQKRCFNGKSLGGHMRRHLALISAAKDHNNKAKAETETDLDCENGADDLLGVGIEENNNGCRSSSTSSSKVSAAEQEETPKTGLIQEKMDELMISVGIGSDDQDQDSYDLRENPKKSWKISDVRTMAGDPNKVAYICKECEKSFPSSRALSGHMRAHTVKGKKNAHICKKCSKWFESARALYGHMKSHSKRPRLSSSSSTTTTTTTTKSDFEVDYPRKKRSVIRYNKLMTPPPPTNPSLSSANASSSAVAATFDFDDEVEDAAVCLMLLSRGTTDLVDSIDTNDAVESKPFPLSQSQASETSADEEKNPPAKKTDSSSSLVSESEINEFENHNNDDAKEAEIELDLEMEMEEATKMAKASDSDSTQAEVVEPQPEKDLKLAAIGTRTDEDDSEMLLHSDPVVDKKTVVVVSEMLLTDVGKKQGYKCRTCNMTFSSHQALGGHRNRHKIIISSSNSSSTRSAMVNESNGVFLGENNEYCYYYKYNGAQNQNQNQKSKEHECAVCFKVFPTGQALGGHKRAHYAGFTESRNTLVRDHQQEDSTADDDLTHLWWKTTEHGAALSL